MYLIKIKNMKNLFVLLFVTIFVNHLFAQKISDFNKPNFENKHFETTGTKSVNSLLDNYDVKFYKIEVDVTNTSKTINSGIGTMYAQVVNNPLNTILLELINSLTVDSVLVNGVNKTFTHANDEITINLSPSIALGDFFTTKVHYHGTSSGSGIGNGNSFSWGAQITWTLSESYHAKDWFPCKQVLSDKADSVQVFITCPNTLKAGSNGLLTNIVPIAGNKLRYEWKSNYPINYYLPSFSVSDYQEYNIYAHPAGIPDSILIQNYLYSNSGYLPYFKAEIDNTPLFIELLSEKYGMYPFKNEKYGHCVAPIGGGMEHQTMTTLSSFNFELIIHELGHQWFGDNVTCSNWQDIWINEGFATYTYYIGLQNLQTQANADQEMLSEHNDIKNTPGGSVYVPLSQIFDENRIFDYRLTYEKGAAIIHSMRFILNNDSLFYSVLQNFQQTYKDSVATGDDFKNMISSMSGIDFTDYFAQWYYGEGYPTYNIVWQQQSDTVSFTVNQQTSMPSITPFFKLPVEIKFFWSGGDTTLRFAQAYNQQQFSAYIPHLINNLQVDPNNWVVDGIANITTGISVNSILQSVIVKPNPAKDFIVLNVNFNTSENDFIIYDISGKNVKTFKMNADVLKIDISDLENGMYFINCINNNNILPAKFIVNK